MSFRIDWIDLLTVQGTLKSLPTPQFKSINSSELSFLYGPPTFRICWWPLGKPQLWLYAPVLAKWCLCFLICRLGFWSAESWPPKVPGCNLWTPQMGPYSKSPAYQGVSVLRNVCKSDLFVVPAKLALIPNSNNRYTVLYYNRFIILFTQIIH